MLLIAALGFFSSPFTGLAQTNLDNTTGLNREGTSLASDGLTETDTSPTSNLRADRPEREELPPEVQARIVQFRREARAYLSRQQALKKQLEGANDEERALIRRKLEHLRREWLAHTREMRRELRDRQAELRDRLDTRREVVDSVLGDVAQASREALRDQKPGRRDD